MRDKKKALVQLAALDVSVQQTQKAISAKLKRLRHAIRRSVGEDPITDPNIRLAGTKPYGID